MNEAAAPAQIDRGMANHMRGACVRCDALRRGWQAGVGQCNWAGTNGGCRWGCRGPWGGASAPRAGRAKNGIAEETAWQAAQGQRHQVTALYEARQYGRSIGWAGGRAACLWGSGPGGIRGCCAEAQAGSMCGVGMCLCGTAFGCGGGSVHVGWQRARPASLGSSLGAAAIG